MGRNKKDINPVEQERREDKKRQAKRNVALRQQRESAYEGVDPKTILKQFYDLIDEERQTTDQQRRLLLSEKRRKTRESLDGALDYLSKHDEDQLKAFQEWEEQFHAKRRQRKVFYFTGTEADIRFGMRPPPPPPRGTEAHTLRTTMPSERHEESKNAASDESSDDDLDDIPIPDDMQDTKEKEPAAPAQGGLLPPPPPVMFRPPPPHGFRPPPPGMYNSFPPPPPPPSVPQLNLMRMAPPRPGMGLHRPPPPRPPPSSLPPQAPPADAVISAEPQVIDRKELLRKMMPMSLRVQRSKNP